MTEQAVIPPVFSHSVKISDTQKGIRIDVHVYANDIETALSEAFEMYTSARVFAKENSIPLAPIEIKAKRNDPKN